MKPVKIKLSIDPTNAAVVAALNSLLLAMGPNETVEAKVISKAVKETFKDETKPVMEIHKVTSGENIASMEIETPPVDDKETGTQEPEKEDATKPVASLEDIREVLGKKVGEHREAIKNELTKLNAKNVSVLSSEHYDSFKAFLDKL